MTYSILHFDKINKKIISGICSNWTGIQVCRVTGRAGVVHTQSWADYKVAHNVIDALEQGMTPDEAIELALSKDKHAKVRQLLVCDFSGRVGVFSGKECVEEFWQLRGESTVLAGNMLSSKKVIEDLYSHFKCASESRPEVAMFNAMKNVHDNAGGDCDKRGDRALSIKSIPKCYREVNEYQLDITIDSAFTGERIYEKFQACMSEHFERDNKILR